MTKYIPICPTGHEKWYSQLEKSLDKKVAHLRGENGFDPGNHNTRFYTGLPPIKTKLSFMIKNVLEGKHALFDYPLMSFLRPRLSFNDIPKTYKFRIYEPEWRRPGFMDIESGLGATGTLIHEIKNNRLKNTIDSLRITSFDQFGNIRGHV